MNHWKKALALTLAGTFLLTGCGSNQSKEQESAHETKDVKSEQETNATEGKIVVYSPQGDETRGSWIMNRAKDELGIDIQFLCAGGGELSDRLVAEKSNPQADVVLGLAQNAMYKLKDENILEPYEPKWIEGLPEVYQGKDGYFNCFWQTPIVLAYNPSFITDAPKSWKELADEKFNGLYGIGSSGSQTTRSYLIGLLWDNVDVTTGEVAEKGWELLQEVYTNAGTMPSNDADIWKAFKDGSMPIIPWWYGGVVNNCKTNDIPVEFVIPEEGTPVVAEGIGLVNGSKQPEIAKEFIDWWGSAETMSAYAEEFGQAPAHPAAIEKCSDEIKKNANMFKAQDIDWEVASKNIDSWLEKIELEIMP